MIESITISGEASFQGEPVVLDGLTCRNYFFGTNGTGKSTIGRVVAAPSAFPDCDLVWAGGRELKRMLYNREFVAQNFGPSTKLRGVFTLGEASKEVKDRIETASADVGRLNAALDSQQVAFAEKQTELGRIESRLTEDCWAQKLKHEKEFGDAFEGFRSSKEKFKQHVLSQRGNTESLLSLMELKAKADKVFVDQPTREFPLPAIGSAVLLASESSSLLGEKIVGKEDVNVAALIKKLGNSDWVRRGREFLQESEGVCPFCQQEAPDGFEQDLNDYFDVTFLTKTGELAELASGYVLATESVQETLDEMLSSTNRYLQTRLSELKAKRDGLVVQMAANCQRLETKKGEPSRSVSLVSSASALADIAELVAAVNAETKTHNAMVDNYAKERGVLVEEVWKYIVETELNRVLDKYDEDTKRISSATKGIEQAITDTKLKIAKLKLEVSELERQTTSVRPTLDAINGLLARFGFTGFSLDLAEDGRSYVLIREDGRRAEDTLSEGEQSFVTFLYFFQLLDGGHEGESITGDKVVVFDDPVSSLDSDILFVVSSLIRRVCDEAGAGKGSIKQVFVLTHNVHFHKEVTHPAKGSKGTRSYWLVRKPDGRSTVQRYDSNPVKTSYHLLWEEIRRPDRSGVTVQNAMRRILEHYFKTLGGLASLDDLLDEFEGDDQLACRSLISWVHDYSHTIHDELYVSVDDTCISMYLAVFKSIFQRKGQDGHYEMMWSEAGKALGLPDDGGQPDDEPTPTLVAAPDLSDLGETA